MMLSYYIITFEQYGEECPVDVWEAIHRFLKVVFSVYGYTRDPGQPHEMHCLCEDDMDSTLFTMLPDAYKQLIIVKETLTDQLKCFVNHVRPKLIDEPGLKVVDLTDEIFNYADFYEPPPPDFY